MSDHLKRHPQYEKPSSITNSLLRDEPGKQTCDKLHPPHHLEPVVCVLCPGAVLLGSPSTSEQGPSHLLEKRENTAALSIRKGKMIKVWNGEASERYGPTLDSEVYLQSLRCLWTSQRGSLRAILDARHRNFHLSKEIKIKYSLPVLPQPNLARTFLSFPLQLLFLSLKGHGRYWKSQRGKSKIFSFCL